MCRLWGYHGGFLHSSLMDHVCTGRGTAYIQAACHVSSTMDGVGGGSGDNLPEGEGPEVLQEQESKCENRD
ncbi:hypothetical protein V9T40_014632 [Parthenolecanium corni]|uniref:Uncharacterized protein n=1 Tax=Parthenolecanium corni TaxID=536013 RepID=A0AAN9XXP0_9HEMI